MLRHVLAAILAAFAYQPDPAMLRRLYEDALARHEIEFGLQDARTAQAARDLGVFLARQGDTRGAQSALVEAVKIDEAAAGPKATVTLEDVAELAAVSAPAVAEGFWVRAAEADDAKLAARALAALGDLHAAADDGAGAAGFYRRALAKQEAASGRDSEPVSQRLNALSHVVELKEGIAMLERAMGIDRRVLGARHPQTASTEANLAGLLVNAKRNDEAIRLATGAMSVFEETLGPDHPRCAITASILAFALEAKGENTKAEQMYRRAVAIDEQAYGAGHPQTAADRRALVEFLKGKKTAGK